MAVAQVNFKQVNSLHNLNIIEERLRSICQVAAGNSNVLSSASLDQQWRKYLIVALLAMIRYRKCPIMWKAFPSYDVIMYIM